jgi:hypothetical protein
VATQQLADAPQEFGVPRAGRFDVSSPLAGKGPVQGAEEDGLGVVALIGHGTSSSALRVH